MTILKKAPIHSPLEYQHTSDVVSGRKKQLRRVSTGWCVCVCFRLDAMYTLTRIDTELGNIACLPVCLPASVAFLRRPVSVYVSTTC